MKNIIYVDAKNSSTCDLVSSVNDGTNRVLIKIKSDVLLNPVLHIGITTVAITADDFVYQIPNSSITAGSNITFYISDDLHTTGTFTIAVASNLSGNWFVNQESDLRFALSTEYRELPYYTKSETDDLLKQKFDKSGGDLTGNATFLNYGNSGFWKTSFGYAAIGTYSNGSALVLSTRNNDFSWIKDFVLANADGIQIAAKNHTHDYLPLTGGNITGSLTINGNKSAVVTGASFATLEEFLNGIANCGMTLMGRWKDTGGWCAGGQGWYRGIAFIQNYPGNSSGYNVSAFVVCQLNGINQTYIGTIDGYNSSNYVAKWSRVANIMPNSVWDNTSNQQLYLASSNEGNYRMFLGVRESGWRLCPHVNSNITLGSPSYRWNQIYSTSASISTSDRNLKKNIEPLTDKYIEFFLKLAPVSFQFVDGTSGRTHIGFISQDVEATMKECGISDLDFAGFCKDQKYETVTKTVETINDETGETETKEVEDFVPVEGEYIYSLRYEEFIALNTEATQRLNAKVEKLNKKIDRLIEILGVDVGDG